MVRIRKSLRKIGHEFFTFLTPTTAKLLNAYMNQRILSGESFSPDSPVIAPSKHCKYRGDKAGKEFLTTKSVRKWVRDAILPRFPEGRSNYGHRRHFDTQLIIAEGQGKVPHNFVMFWMGHKGDIESLYTTNKGILPPKIVEEMRDDFRRSEEVLDLERCAIDPLEKQKVEAKARLETMGHDELQKALELLRKLSNGESSESSDPKTQSSSSIQAGNTSETYPTERRSSENRSRDNSSRESLRTRF